MSKFAKFAKALPRFRRSSPKDLLPPHGYLYFDHLHAEFQSNPNQEISQEISQVVDDLLKKRQDYSLTWNHLYTFDLILARRLPPERLAREVWNLRARFHDVAGLALYEAYLASKPPDLASQIEEKVLKSDIEYLLGEIYLRYAITPVNERARDRISKRIMIGILVGILLIILVIILSNLTSKQLSATLLPVMFIGAMGGLVSMQQRYQSVSREGDPIDNISQLTQNWWRLFLPAVNGAIFAVLLYMVIRGKLVEGTLFPILQDVETPEGGIQLKALFAQGKPASAIEYAKLIVWAFLAGFAERLVPDTLSSLVSKKDVDKKKAAA